MTYEAWRISYQSSEQAARAAYAECARLQAKIEVMEKQEPVAWVVPPSNRPHLGEHAMQDAAWEARQRGGTAKAEPLYALPGAQPAPLKAIENILTEVMDIAVSNGADSRSMPDEYVEVAAWLCGIPAQSAPSVPDGWLRVIDEALVTAHIGVANAHDTYEQAKAKLDNLIGFHVDVATDPAVNGGYKLVPIEPTTEIRKAMHYAYWQSPQLPYHDGSPELWNAAYAAMLNAAPETQGLPKC